MKTPDGWETFRGERGEILVPVATVRDVESRAADRWLDLLQRLAARAAELPPGADRALLLEAARALSPRKGAWCEGRDLDELDVHERPTTLPQGRSTSR